MVTSHRRQSMQRGVAAVDLGIKKRFYFWRNHGLEAAEKIALFFYHCKRSKSQEKKLTYPDLPFARIPTPHCDDAPVYVFITLPSLPIHINVQDDQLNPMEEYLDPDFQAE